MHTKRHQRHHNISRRQNKTDQAIKSVAQKLSVHKQRINRTNSKTNIGNDGVFNRLFDDNSHILSE